MTDSKRLKAEFRKNHQGRGNMSLKRFAEQTAAAHATGHTFAPYAKRWLESKGFKVRWISQMGRYL